MSCLSHRTWPIFLPSFLNLHDQVTPSSSAEAQKVLPQVASMGTLYAASNPLFGHISQSLIPLFLVISCSLIPFFAHVPFPKNTFFLPFLVLLSPNFEVQPAYAHKKRPIPARNLPYPNTSKVVKLSPSPSYCKRLWDTYI